MTAPYPREWRENLKRFKTLFFGTSRNAKKCKIVNPEILDFEYDQKYERFTAKAIPALHIENHALGYRIQLYLMEFGLRGFLEGKCLFKSKYQHLSPKNQKEEEQWRKNRLKAYNGSLRHFITALASKTLDTDKSSEKTYTAEIPESSQEKLILSDIELAYKVSPLDGLNKNTAFAKKGLSFYPYPSSTVSRKRPITIYFEVNNLLLNDSGNSSYSVAYEMKSVKPSFWQKINPFSKGSFTISSSYSRRGTRRNEQEYLSIDLERIKPCEYTLTVHVTDEITRASRSSVTRIQVVE